MEALRYLDFDLQIEHSADRYVAQIIRSPAGEASSTFTLPFSADRLENLLLKMAPMRGRVRGFSTEEEDAAREFGGGLFESVFSGEVLGCLRDSLNESTRYENTGVRIRLRLQSVPELADLPWEYLFDKTRKLFLAQSTYTPIVRYIEMPERIRSLTTELPLRILVMISRPEDGQYPLIDADSERARLTDALAPLTSSGRVQVDWMENATLRQLQSNLRLHTYHVFHYIGHGGFDPRAGEGVLVLEDEMHRSALTPASRLSTLLHDHRSLRLTVLNSCEGARNSRNDPFAGLAATLVQQGIPAVVAMQFEITDQAAITFSSEFYAALAAGLPVDAAMAETRKAILGQVNDIEWGTPVLYMRAADGVLFNLTAPVPTPPPPPVEALRRGPIKLVLTPKQEHNAFGLTLTNEGEVALEVALGASDEEGAGSYRLPSRVTVPPSASTTVEMSARPRRRRFNGSRQKRGFKVTASDGDGVPPVSASGEFEDVPFNWVPATITGGAVFAVSAVAVLLLVLGGGGSDGDDDGPDGTGSSGGGNLTVVPDTPEPEYATGIYFTSDETGLEQIYVMKEDGSPLRQLTDGPLAARLPDVALYEDILVYVTQDGERSEISIANVNGENAYQVVPTDGAKLEPDLSPDSQYLVFEVKRGDNFEIYVSDITGANARNLTENAWADIDPVWSPDGTEIAFASNRDVQGQPGAMEIYVMNADGSDPVRLTFDERFAAEPTWSPDGETIAYESNLAGSFDIWSMSLDGGGQTRVTRNSDVDEFDPAWSPDGDQIAYTAVENGNADVEVVGLDDLAVEKLTDSPANEAKPSWGLAVVNRNETETTESR